MPAILYPAALILLIAWAATGAEAAPSDTWTLKSPNGHLSATLALMKPSAAGYSGERTRLFCRVELERQGRRAEVLPWSPLGIERRDAAFLDGLQAKDQGSVRQIEETYRLAHGKRTNCRVSARQQSFRFSNAQGASVELVLRVSDDGVAFRYVFPGSGREIRTVTAEHTGFRFPAGSRAWMAPYSESTQWTPAYEEYYLNDIAVGTPSPKRPGWAFPALFRTGESGPWVLLTEAAVDGSYCGCRLAQESPQAVYRLRFPDPEEGWGHGTVLPQGTLPWATPWRVLIVAPTLAGIVESTLVTDLNPASRVTDAGWIKPGRVSWSWWSDHDSPQDYKKMVDFIDLAAEMGWEYFLVDANWTLMDHGNVRELTRYARSKGVGIFLWYNSGGPHNIVTEKPRGCMTATEVRQPEFALLKKWGVAGVKIDFFQSDKQGIMGLYHDILRDAAKYQMLVNFHGCTVPRGWERTWPHLLSMEAVKGEECYTFAKEYPKQAPAYNTVLPFTRNAVGPMDYTPCAFTDDKYPHLTTNAHELALSVLYETGLLHFADRVSAYRNLPPEPKAFLKTVPVTWDETRYLAGEPGQFVALARRKGSTWYLAAINGQPRPRQMSLPLATLGQGGWSGNVIADGTQPRTFASRAVSIPAGKPLEISLLPYGGAVATLHK